MSQFEPHRQSHRIIHAIASLLIGTLLALAMAVTDARGAEGRWLTVEVTAYCPCALCCDIRTERTANGTDTNVSPYGIAAGPDISLGTSVWVPLGGGYLDLSRGTDRWFGVDDRGGALRTEWRRSGVTRIDLRFKSHASAKAFGRKLMMVFIVSPL